MCEQTLTMSGNKNSRRSTIKTSESGTRKESVTETEVMTLPQPEPEVIEYLANLNFRVLSFIASGTTCSVYKLERKKDTMSFAAKVICHRTVVPKFREILLPNELMIVRIVDHPNVIKTENVVELPEYSIIITEFAANGDLLRHIQRHERPDIALYRKWFIDVTQAIAYLHQNGIGHRDIKADNVLLCGDIAKIADFGYAIFFLDQFGQPIFCTTYCGTAEYAAPEVLRHQPYKVTIADCFSLGVLLYLLVTRKLPFGCGNAIRSRPGAQEQYNKIINKQWPVCGAIEQDLRLYSLLDQLLNPDVRERFSAIQVLQHSWIVTKNDDA